MAEPDIEPLNDSVVDQVAAIILRSLLRQPDGTYASTNQTFITHCHRIAHRLADAGLLAADA